jgi:hypothetical protein
VKPVNSTVGETMLKSNIITHFDTLLHTIYSFHDITS